ncbi:MAG: hypothetical protein L6R38_000343 [Xanthoria sp. 2 TBL-2021]|nr:MAG: hypothetical protein L6R38_000343 [Xanthoria sp. 2 TBL-2021]
MSKRTVFTTITPLPAGITRETVIETLHNHFEMIEYGTTIRVTLSLGLNPLVIERHPIKAPRKASPEEFHSIWYHVVDKINYFPGYSGRTEFDVCFHDLKNGLQTHVYAPLGLDIKDKWTLGGTLPHEPKEPVEIGLGVPKEGLWLREDVDMRCNIMATGFVKKTLKKAHGTLVERLVEKAHLTETELHNNRLEEHNSNSILSYYSDPRSPGLASPLRSPDVSQARPNADAFPNPMQGQSNLDHRGSLGKAPYPSSPPMEGMQQASVDPRYSQAPPQSRYSQPPPDPRYALPPEDARYSQPPTRGHDPRMTHQAYTPVELPSSAASSEPQMAELDSSSAQSRRY